MVCKLADHAHTTTQDNTLFEKDIYHFYFPKTSMPRKYFKILMSFISNYELENLLKLSNSKTSLHVTRISSTYTNKTINN